MISAASTSPARAGASAPAPVFVEDSPTASAIVSHCRVNAHAEAQIHRGEM
jgi:hypothetical protein